MLVILDRILEIKCVHAYVFQILPPEHYRMNFVRGDWAGCVRGVVIPEAALLSAPQI